jgi:coenzyme PQQ precursor peptide PqqA
MAAATKSWNLTQAVRGIMSSVARQSIRAMKRRISMTWQTPKIVEVALGGEINCYACARVK